MDEVRDVSRLRRSRDDRVIAGVAGGLGRHLDIDPLLIRIVLGVLVLFGGTGIVAYVILWLVVPEDGAPASIWSRWRRADDRRVATVGIAIAAIASAFVFLGSVHFFIPGGPGFVGVIIVALIALAILVRTQRPHDHRPNDEQTGPRPPTPAPSALDTGHTIVDESATAEAPGGFGDEPTQPVPMPPPPPRPRRPRSHLFAMTMALAAIACGVTGIYDAGHHVAPAVYPGIVLSAAGLGLLVSSWFGRARLLIPVGIIAAVFTALLSVVDHGPFGDITHRPTAAVAVRGTYQLGAGNLVLDLRGLSTNELAQLDGRTVHVDARVGDVEIWSPSGLDTTVTAKIDGGNLHGFSSGDTSGHHVSETLEAPDTSAPNLTIDVDLRFGQVNVHTYCQPTTGGTSRVQACN
jgi:phage shock protein PspC (stress-responsive transcriptional regulator)